MMGVLGVQASLEEKSPPQGKKSPPQGKKLPPQGKKSPPQGKKSPPKGKKGWAAMRQASVESARRATKDGNLTKEEAALLIQARKGKMHLRPLSIPFL